MKVTNWLLAIALLFLSQLFAQQLLEYLTLTRIEPYLNSEVHERFGESARNWQREFLSAGDDLESVVRDLEMRLGTRVSVERIDPIDLLERPGEAGVYFHIDGPGGSIVAVIIDENTVVEVGPLPGTFGLSALPWLAPLVLHTVFAAFAIWIVLGIALKPVKAALVRSDYSDEPLRKAAIDELLDRYLAIEYRNESLEGIARQNIENQRDFLHGVAHEFRAPLARLQFAMNINEPGRSEKLETVAEDMDALVTEILQYSRYRHGQFDVNIARVDLTELLQELGELIVDPRGAIRIEFGATLAAPLVVETDRGLVERSVTNLLLNAVRFAKSTILLDVVVHDHLVEIIVEDDGPGVPPGKAKLVFEPFTRLDPSRSRTSGGTGLGLAIVQGIAVKLGGSVSVEDASIGGARFSMLIPK